MKAGARKLPKWEAELWSYISKGDGETCPLHSQCQVRRQGGWCLSDRKEGLDIMSRFIDDDDFTLSSHGLIKFDFRCAMAGRLFRLVGMLADMYLQRAKVQGPPVPTDIISLADDNRPIEVRLLPLKAHHGAIWCLSDSWVIQLKNDDTPARQRFTLFHEMFHILAHCRASPVFRKAGVREGSFNEALADHFAGRILAPRKWVKEKWEEVKDLNQMAEIFEVPNTVMWLGLRGMNLI